MCEVEQGLGPVYLTHVTLSPGPVAARAAGGGGLGILEARGRPQAAPQCPRLPDGQGQRGRTQWQHRPLGATSVRDPHSGPAPTRGGAVSEPPRTPLPSPHPQTRLKVCVGRDGQTGPVTGRDAPGSDSPPRPGEKSLRQVSLRPLSAATRGCGRLCSPGPQHPSPGHVCSAQTGALVPGWAAEAVGVLGV